MYRTISDYGLIGDLHSVALVSRDGSIDYCSLPWLDSPTVFASLLDDKNGGYFSLCPAGVFSAEQSYVTDTNILACTFTTREGVSLMYDFMPVEEARIRQYPRGIHRCLKALQGRCRFVLTLVPRPAYALQAPAIVREGNHFTVRSEEISLYLSLTVPDFHAEGTGSGTLSITFTLEEGQDAHIDLSLEPPHIDGELAATCPFEQTRQYWEKWVHFCLGEHCLWLGRFSAMVNRSVLALKLLTFEPTGAIAAAATTSLPEVAGGERNWDYRFSWIRDSSFTLKAFFALGHINEADSFIRWLHGTYRGHGSSTLKVMYTIHGNAIPREIILSHLNGYRNSKPVRIGNAASHQHQWDIFGEIMDAALRLSDYAGKIDEGMWPFFRDICSMAIQNWRKPDDGIWEVRNGPHHFVYSKVMCWVALDRGITIARRFGFEAPLGEWKNERELIKLDVLEKGYSKQLNSFVQRYGSEELDASLLLLPLVDFLPTGDARIQGTIDACMEHLLHRGFIRRYLSADGLEGKEGGFVLCNFWMIECLALSGRNREAAELMDETMKAASHLGLFSEEYESRQAELLGNFPQAFSHIGFINAVTALVGAGRSSARDTVEEHSLRERLHKLLPFRVTLNKPHDELQIDLPEQVDIMLKHSLGRLQGAFFDPRQGCVNYDAMKRSASFREYLQLAESLHGFDPSRLHTDSEKKAFWLNIYNILIIHGVIALDIRRSVLEIMNFFGRIGYNIGGMIYTPDDIEHGILRKNRRHPAFPSKPFSVSDPRLAGTVEKFDPRIHFALVCASSSCPPIEFYDRWLIDQQLDAAGRSFIRRRGLELDSQKGIVYLSRIFQWYAHDFGNSRQKLLNFILQFADDHVRTWISQHGQHLRIRYLPYNWNLNRTLNET